MTVDISKALSLPVMPQVKAQGMNPIFPCRSLSLCVQSGFVNRKKCLEVTQIDSTGVSKWWGLTWDGDIVAARRWADSTSLQRVTERKRDGPHKPVDALPLIARNEVNKNTVRKGWAWQAGCCHAADKSVMTDTNPEKTNSFTLVKLLFCHLKLLVANRLAPMETIRLGLRSLRDATCVPSLN